MARCWKTKTGKFQVNDPRGSMRLVIILFTYVYPEKFNYINVNRKIKIKPYIDPMVMWTGCLKDSCSTTSQGGCGKGLGPTCPADDSIFSPCNENHWPKPPKSFGREPELLLKAMSMSWSSWGQQRKKHHEKTTTWKTLEFHSLKLEVWHLSSCARKQKNKMVFNIFYKHQFSGVRVASFIKYHSMSSPQKTKSPIYICLSFIATFYGKNTTKSLLDFLNNHFADLSLLSAHHLAMGPIESSNLSLQGGDTYPFFLGNSSFQPAAGRGCWFSYMVRYERNM